MAADPGGQPAGMKSVLQALRILEEIAYRQPVGVSSLAREMQLPKSTVQRGIRTLAHAGWVQQVDAETRRWRLSHKALTVGFAGSAESVLQEVATEQMRAIRDATGETVHLGVIEANELIVINRLDGTQPLRTFLRLGATVSLHASSSGRAILAALPDTEIDRLLDLGIRRYNDATTTDRALIWEELRRTRERGYGVNEGEWREGIAAVGAAIVARDGRPQAGISVSMPLNRFREIDMDAVGAVVVAAARKASRATYQ